MPTDLELARASGQLDIKAIHDLLLLPSRKLLRDKVQNTLEKEPLWDPTIRPHLNQAQSLLRSLRLCYRLLQLRKLHNWSQEEYREALSLSDDKLPTTLHEIAFINIIYSQGTNEQREQWLPRCQRLEFVGCYAQTELAHGSNVQGLLTTATYDYEDGRDEFIIDSGGIEGAKWWIGGAGVLANFALVQAILKVPRRGEGVESLGPHLFLVPIRSLTTHLPLPGVTVGDIGPKAYGGFAGMDNAYIKFDNVRIPRTNMLMRFAELARGGKYTKAKHDKISYGSMVAMRARMPENMGWVLGKAVTTAIRYCVIRRQFTSPGELGGNEIQVIYYASVKHRLFPLLAQSYAFIVCGRELQNRYTQMQEALVSRGDTSMLPEIHSLSIALKVATTNDAVKGMEVARRAMGGHGFSWMSGVGVWWANSTASQTYEGDNYVIAQQTARGLLKHLQRLHQAKAVGEKDYELPPSSGYLNLAARSFWLNPSVILSLLSSRAAYLLGQLALAISTSPQKSWTDHSFATFALCRAHAELYLASTFFSILSSRPDIPPPVYTLVLIYSLHTITSSLSDLLESETLTPSNARELRYVYDWILMEGLSVSDVVSLTDAFGFRDWEVGVLGGKEGRVYEQMWDEVQWREGKEGRGKREKVAEFEGGQRDIWERVREEARGVLGFWKEGGEVQNEGERKRAAKL
ncbi:acyl-CoA oxidase [Terfezia boudieri ATCC MYA-4762]|uniref:Acyl-coenzyme A oxidase n=1 Tax=Terfezia boudieri ATCC MYA-4762 TaxID=1051890 RepID=A0A3N4LCL9_9PEZI|nr:acyl-CoA oxidase [Terfezia boudieri ATCC MYA-4762]